MDRNSLTFKLISHSLTHSLTHSFTHSLTHSLTHTINYLLQLLCLQNEAILVKARVQYFLIMLVVEVMRHVSLTVVQMTLVTTTASMMKMLE